MSTTSITAQRHVLNCDHVVVDDRIREVKSQVRCPECSDATGKTVRPRVTSTGALADFDQAQAGPSDADATDATVTSIDAFLASSPAKARMDRYEAAKAAAAQGGDAAAVLATPVASTDRKPRTRRNPDRVTGLRLSPVRRQAIEAALGEDVGDVLADGNGPNPLALDAINLNRAQVDALMSVLPMVCDASDDVHPAPVRNAACRVAAWLAKFPA